MSGGFILTPKNNNKPKPKTNKEEENKKSQVKPRDTLTEENVKDINFFKEDLECLDREVEESEKIYDEIHGLYRNLTGGEYVPRNIRDVAELAKTMVSARTYRAQAVNNRISLKKTIADLNFRNGGGLNEEDSEIAAATARQIISIIRTDPDAVKPVGSKKKNDPNKNKPEDEALLEKTINQRIKSGDIPMSKNDNLVGINEHIVTRYDSEHDRFVGVDRRTGEIVKDLPADRLPDMKSVSKVNKQSAVLNDGNEIKIYDSLEFDDEYVDDDP